MYWLELMTTISYTSKQTSLLCVSSATPGEKDRETSKIKLLKPAKRGLPCKLSRAYINISRCLFFTLLSCVDPIYVLALASLRERYIDRENTLFDSSLFPHDVSPLPSTPQSPQIIMDVFVIPSGAFVHLGHQAVFSFLLSPRCKGWILPIIFFPLSRWSLFREVLTLVILLVVYVITLRGSEFGAFC